jgi:hypothetical protein
VKIEHSLLTKNPGRVSGHVWLLTSMMSDLMDGAATTDVEGSKESETCDLLTVVMAVGVGQRLLKYWSRRYGRLKIGCT